MASLWLIDGLKARMQWLQARQTLVSGNVANANTVGFKPLDLTPFQYEPSHTGLAVTHGAHQASASDTSGGDPTRRPQFETKPSGNSVVLEDEMAKLADIQLDYQTVTSLYSKSLGLLRMAVGGR